MAKGEASAPKSKKPSAGLANAQRVIKGVALVVGGACTLLSLMSVVGIVTSNGVARLVVALILGIGFPAFIADRLLPKDDVKRAPGLTGDVFALVLLGFALVFVAFAHPLTEGLLAREGDRQAVAGNGLVARVAYVLAGVRADEPPAPSAGPAGSAAPSASASAGGDGGT
jgi:hypothetical protein